MRFTCIAFAVTCFGLFQCFIKSEDVHHEKSKEEIDEESAKIKYENHTFVALIDIVFTDRSKRSCTGSIIHNNVVITAAHCFVHEFEENVQPEVTTSFVVIGSKKMFDSGYEQYLPIERILLHPKFGHGWTADLALVYTFAGMTSDKPGEIIPLAGERMSNPVDSNVTVFSWGHCADEQLDRNWNTKKTTKRSSDEASSDDSECEETGVATGEVDSKRSRGGHKKSALKAQSPKRRPATKKPARQQHRFQTQFRQNKGLQEYQLLKQKVWHEQSEEQSVRSKRPPMTKPLSRYLSSNEGKEDRDYRLDENQPSRNSTSRPRTQTKNHHSNLAVDTQVRKRLSTRPFPEPMNNIKTFYKNWRRSMGKQVSAYHTLGAMTSERLIVRSDILAPDENKLTVEIFGFVNLATCKKIVEGALPPRYEIKSGEVICYSSEDHYITDEDSGAPAIRHGQLVAVTVGGAQCEGDHVGVGMKMSCYCSWIAENLPGNNENMNCCKNCCNVNKHSEDSSKAMFRKKNQHY